MSSTVDQSDNLHFVSSDDEYYEENPDNSQIFRDLSREISVQKTELNGQRKPKSIKKSNSRDKYYNKEGIMKLYSEKQMPKLLKYARKEPKKSHCLKVPKYQQSIPVNTRFMPDNVIYEISEQSVTYIPHKNSNGFHDGRRTSLPNLQELYQREIESQQAYVMPKKKQTMPVFNQTMKSFYDSGQLFNHNKPSLQMDSGDPYEINADINFGQTQHTGENAMLYSSQGFQNFQPPQNLETSKSDTIYSENFNNSKTTRSNKLIEMHRVKEIQFQPLKKVYALPRIQQDRNSLKGMQIQKMRKIVTKSMNATQSSKFFKHKGMNPQNMFANNGGDYVARKNSLVLQNHSLSSAKFLNHIPSTSAASNKKPKYITPILNCRQ